MGPVFLKMSCDVTENIKLLANSDALTIESLHVALKERPQDLDSKLYFYRWATVSVLAFAILFTATISTSVGIATAIISLLPFSLFRAAIKVSTVHQNTVRECARNLSSLYEKMTDYFQTIKEDRIKALLSALNSKDANEKKCFADDLERNNEKITLATRISRLKDANQYAQYLPRLGFGITSWRCLQTTITHYLDQSKYVKKDSATNTFRERWTWEF